MGFKSHLAFVSALVDVHKSRVRGRLEFLTSAELQRPGCLGSGHPAPTHRVVERWQVGRFWARSFPAARRRQATLQELTASAPEFFKAPPPRRADGVAIPQPFGGCARNASGKALR